MQYDEELEMMMNLSFHITIGKLLLHYNIAVEYEETATIVTEMAKLVSLNFVTLENNSIQFICYNNNNNYFLLHYSFLIAI